MAAYRRSFPLRQSLTSFHVEDGTTCRMPSPLPGPLRGESNFEPTGLRGRLDHPAPGGSSIARSQVIPVTLIKGEAA